MEAIIVLAAIAIGILVVGWLFKLVKTTLQTVLLVAFILLALYFVFGIGPGVIWEHLQTWLGQALRR